MADATFLADLIELFDRTVQIEPLVSRDVAGKPAYGTAVDYAARIVMKNVAVRTPEGTVIVGRGTIYFPQVLTASLMDRLTLPAGYSPPTQPPILSISTVDEETSGSHTSMVIG